MSAPFFRVDRLTKRFGGLTAVNRFSLGVEAGEIVGLIGPNGAGKTTVFHLLSGFHAPSDGAIRFKGVSVVGAWDSNQQEFAVKGRLDVHPNDMFALFVMGAWTNDDGDSFIDPATGLEVGANNNGGNYYTFVTPEKPPTAPPSVEWPTFHNNVPRQGKSPSNFQPPIDLVWKDGPFLLQLWNGPVLSDGILFSAPLDGTLRARDPFTGEILWCRHLGDQYYYTPTMVGHDGVLYAPFYGTAGGHLYALNEYTGDTIWVDGSESGLDFNARIMMGYSDGLVFGSSWGGQIYAVNATDGSVVWTYQTGDLPFGGPSVNAGVVYMASIGGTVFALDEFSGSLVWSATLDGTTTSSPLYANGLIYEGTYSGTMYALDAFTGATVWSTGGFNLIDVSTPAYDGTAIYFGDFNSEYVALDAADGTLIWRSSVSGPVATSPALANGFLYGTCWYCPLYTFDTVDGCTNTVIQTSFFMVKPPFIRLEWLGKNPRLRLNPDRLDFYLLP